jgi:tetratricopeptide (TPR) repeat protein
VAWDLVGRLAGTLLEKVRYTEERRALAQPSQSLDVYVLTAHGKAMLHTYSPDGMREARRFFTQAMALDPNYAPTWVWLGMTNTIDSGLRLTGEWNPSRAGEVLVQVKRAVALDPDLPIAYVALAQAQSLARDYTGALASAERCMQLSPDDPDCLYIIGKSELDVGRTQAAVRHMEQALDRNPVPPAYLPGFYATALWAERRYEEALTVAADCLVRAPDSWYCRQTRVVALVELGRLAEPREEAARLILQVPTMTAHRFGLIFADSAATLRDRRVAAALAAGLPI